MSVDVGTATGYLDLDISGFLKGLQSAQSEANKSTKNIVQDMGDKIQGVGGKMESAGKTLTSFVTTPIIGLGTAVVKVSSDFESGMSKVQAISGATGQDLVDLREKAKEMGAKTKFSATESAAAFEYMAMAGWKTGDMLDGIEGIMNLAAASGEDLATTSDIVTDALTAFGLKAEDSGHFADVLAAASSNANTNVSMMGETFKYAAPVAGALGFSVEDTAEAIGLMANAGIKGSQAGTSLRQLFTSLSGEVKICGKELGDVTIQTTNADGSMRDLNSILEDCRSAFSKLSESEQASAAEAIVGKNAMSGFLALMNASESDINKLSGAIDNCNGKSKEMADVMNDNLAGQITLLKSALEGLGIQLGEIIVPYVKDFVSVLQGLVQKFSELPKGVQETIIKFALVAAVVGPVLLVLGKITSTVGKITSGIGGIIGKLSGLGSAASAASAPTAAASSAVGALSKNALGLVAAGAGILLASAGLALLAQSAIALANAGGPAIACMGGLVAALALLAGGAALVAAPLTAGAAGLVAFGAALALVGVGVLAASSGMAILAAQLPTISEYGLSASVNILALGGAMTVFSVGAIAAGAACIPLGAGLIAVGAGLTVASVGSTTAAAGATLLSAGLTALSAAAALLAASLAATGGGLNICGTGLSSIASNATSAATGLAAFGVAATASFVPITAGAASTIALTAAMVALAASLGVVTVECGLLSAATLAISASMSNIESSASSAADSLSDMVDSVDIVKSGLNALGDIAKSAINSLVNAFSSGAPSAKDAGKKVGDAITEGVNAGMKPLPTNVQNTLNKVNSSLTTSANKNKNTVSSSMKEINNNVSSNMNSLNSTVSRGVSKVNSTVTSGLKSLESSVKRMANQAKGWGADIINGLANGIKANLGKLSSAVDSAANTIYSKLHFSVPDEGPLTEYESWMPDFMKGLAKGINDNSHLVKSAMQGVAEDMVIEPDDSVTGLFSEDDTSKLKSYNIVLIDTLGVYKQLVEQMRQCAEYSMQISGDRDNGLLNQVERKVNNNNVPEQNGNNNDDGKKPDTLNIPITIGDEHIETVVVDLLRREVRT